MTLLALSVLLLRPSDNGDSIANWVTLPESTMQVELHLHKNGAFEAHEYWTGAQSKPMPNVAIEGKWTKQWDAVTLEIQGIYSPFGATHPTKSKKLPIRAVHLFWTDSLGRAHSLSKSARKPALISFGPGGWPVSGR